MEGFNTEQIKQLREIVTEVVQPLDARMERGFAALTDDIAELRAELKGDVDSLRNEVQQGFASIHAETRDIRNRLDAIESELKNHSGYAKEIDHLMERVRAIEKYLGMLHKTAA